VEKSTIYEKIEKKGIEEAQAIIEEGKEHALKIKNDLMADARTEANKILEKANQISNERIKTATTQFEQAAKQTSLQNKKNLIDKVINLAYEKLKALDDNSLFKFVVKKVASENLNGDELIQVSKNDFNRYLHLFSTGTKKGSNYLLDKLNDALGSKYQLQLTNDYANIDGGFIVIGKNYDLDFSFSALLSTIKDEYEVEIAQILFNEGE